MLCCPGVFTSKREMPGKRKRFEPAVPAQLDGAQPLSAIAAARLKAEADTEGTITPAIAIVPGSLTAVPPSIIAAFPSEDSDSEQQEALVAPTFKLCNWRREPSAILSDTKQELTVNLNKHTTIALIGCYDLKVLKGAVHINGANIGTIGPGGEKNKLYRVHSPATHPILKLRGLDAVNHVQFISCGEPAPLATLSPLFADIWNVDAADTKYRSFSIVSASLYC